MTSLDSFRCCKTLKVGSKTYAYYSLPTAEKNGLKGISRLPFSTMMVFNASTPFADDERIGIST